jgi:glycosidase
MRFIVLFSLLALATLCSAERPVIYQLMVRHFGNLDETRKPYGSLEENGCGKFADLTETRLKAIRDLGSTHVWLTGVLQQATRTDYRSIGQPSDDPDICKGMAGSPYAIKDWFDVCPDYAIDPVKRLEEFQSLVTRCHDAGLKVLIDFIPNHVSRAYGSDIRPELSFGAQDDRLQFFSRDNSFYYLRLGSPPLRLPTAGQPGCDGLFEGEMDHGRVTGNNVASWTPSGNDWYETVKLNYGWNFMDGRPGPDAFSGQPPRTWQLMDAVLAYWQKHGVDGFRCDMAHMVPMAFWQWSLKRAKERDPGSYFIAEAYENDPAKLTDGNVLEALTAAGFDAIYDDPSYDLIKGIYDDGKWANDLSGLIQDERSLFHQSLRYAENHDEVRLANPAHWRGAGANVGLPVSSVLFALGRGPIMLYNGQEVGEPALGAEGHGGDDARTTIFDYWSLPELVKWHKGQLSPEQVNLRASYARLLQAMHDPVFQKGRTLALNGLNHNNTQFGRVENETASGHWLCALLREDSQTKRAAVVLANLHPTQPMNDLRIDLPAAFSGRALKVITLTDGAPMPDVTAQQNSITAKTPLPPLGVWIVWLEGN